MARAGAFPQRATTEAGRPDGRTTAFPTDVGLAATGSPDVIEAVGYLPGRIGVASVKGLRQAHTCPGPCQAGPLARPRRLG